MNLTAHATVSIAALFVAARSLAIAHMGLDSGHLHLDMVLGGFRLVVQYNGALYSCTLVDIRDAGGPITASTPSGVLANEWDSGVLTAINSCAKRIGA